VKIKSKSGEVIDLAEMRNANEPYSCGWMATAVIDALEAALGVERVTAHSHEMFILGYNDALQAVRKAAGVVEE
jgi:hypothetical protein